MANLVPDIGKLLVASMVLMDPECKSPFSGHVYSEIEVGSNIMLQIQWNE